MLEALEMVLLHLGEHGRLGGPITTNQVLAARRLLETPLDLARELERRFDATEADASPVAHPAI